MISHVLVALLTASMIGTDKSGASWYRLIGDLHCIIGRVKS